MRVEWIEADAAAVRGLASTPGPVEDDVRRILERVRADGDAALHELTAELDGVDVPSERLRVGADELEAAAGSLDPELRVALETAIANVERVALAALREPVAVEGEQGQRVELLEVPVRRAGAYVPGGRAAYPSSVVMCAVTARVAGVEQVALCTPPGDGGRIDPVVLAACALCGVDEVFRVGGAQAIGALAYGTESIPRVDVIAGPGNPWVTEAKRQVFGAVGIDGLAGPSELVVVASAGADPQLVALDLAAQAEHGPEGVLAAIADDQQLLDGIERALRELGGPDAAAVALVAVSDTAAAVALANEIAPEHLELVGERAEALAGAVRAAGCVFVGPNSGTAFGDYVTGSNHVLPTGGAARFASGLGPAAFRRQMAVVEVTDAAAAALAPHGAALALSEGYPLHAESMGRRA